MKKFFNYFTILSIIFICLFSKALIANSGIDFICECNKAKVQNIPGEKFFIDIPCNKKIDGLDIHTLTGGLDKLFVIQKPYTNSLKALGQTAETNKYLIFSHEEKMKNNSDGSSSNKLSRFTILINRNSFDIKFTIDVMDDGQPSADFSEALQILEVDYSCDSSKK